MRFFLNVTFLIFSFFVNGQELQDTSFLVQIDSITFAEVSISFDESGREISKSYNYLDSADLENKLFDNVVNEDNVLFDLEKEMIKSNRKFNTLNGILSQFSNVNYSEKINERKKDIFNGEWKLKINDSVYFVKSNASNTTIVNKSNSSQKMKIEFIRNKLINIKLAGENTPFFEGNCFLEIREKNGLIYFVGKLNDGQKVILKR